MIRENYKNWKTAHNCKCEDNQLAFKQFMIGSMIIILLLKLSWLGIWNLGKAICNPPKRPGKTEEQKLKEHYEGVDRETKLIQKRIAENERRELESQAPKQSDEIIEPEEPKFKVIPPKNGGNTYELVPKERTVILPTKVKEVNPGRDYQKNLEGVPDEMLQKTGIGYPTYN